MPAMIAGTDFWSGIAGGGGGMLALVGGWFKLRSSREARFNARYDQRFEKLEAEVADCKQRDARMVVIETCFRLTIPELQRLDRTNLTLKQVALLLRSLPRPDNQGEWAEWIDKIDAAEARA